jgi:ZIP family zinc transporter
MTSELLLLGAAAGFTIYLGLPLARIRRAGPRLRGFLNALSVGILVFLLVEIVGKSLETVERGVVAAVRGTAPTGELLHAALFFLGFGIGLLSMVWFESKFIPRTRETSASSARRLALMIAVGIGIHNFSEGLAIGQLYAAGSISLALTLVIGFGLHNATEGFGIAGPLTGERPSYGFLALAGLIGGGPTFIGSILGSLWVSRAVETFVLALAGGAILYIVGELLHIGRRQGLHGIVMGGLLVGFMLAYGTELYIMVSAGGELYEEAVVYSWPKKPVSVENGARIYARNCVVCHGETGAGKGPAAAALARKPQDFTNARWAAGETDADWYDVLSFGRPHTAMTGWHVKLSESERWDVIAYLRQLSYQQGAGPPAGARASAP